MSDMTHRQPSRSGCALPPKCAKNENKISNKKIKTQNKMMQRLSLLYSPETVVGGFIASCLAAQPRSSWSTRTIARLRHPRPTLSFISSSLPLPLFIFPFHPSLSLSTPRSELQNNYIHAKSGTSEVRHHADWAERIFYRFAQPRVSRCVDNLSILRPPPSIHEIMSCKVSPLPRFTRSALPSSHPIPIRPSQSTRAGGAFCGSSGRATA